MRRVFGVLAGIAFSLVLLGDVQAQELPKVRVRLTKALLGGLIVSNPPGVTSSGSITPNSLTWPQGATNPTITQSTQADASSPQNLTVAPQAPGASCSNATNCTSGSLLVNVAAPGSGGSHAYLQVQEAGSGQVWIGAAPTLGTGGVFTTTPSGSNFALAGGGAGSYFNVASGGTLHFTINAADVATLTNTVMTMSTAPTLQFASSLATPAINQVAQASTSSGNGANGQAFALTAQAGQAATGAGNNGGNGAPLQLSSGALGTSGSATAGVAGEVDLQVGGTTQLAVGPTAVSGGPAGIGYPGFQPVSITASSNTTKTLTQAQYVSGLVVLTGTLTNAAVVTVALPNVTASLWLFDISGVTFTSGSIKWTCNGGTATASISSLTTTAELVKVLCRGTTAVLDQ